MTSYLANFSIYTLAMVGIIFTALFVFKKAMNGNMFSKKSSYLQVEETLNLSPRKTLYVVKAGGEKFLLAGDVDRTALIARLDGKIQCLESEIIREDKSLDLASQNGIESLEEFASIINFQRGKGKENKGKGPMMRELARKLNTI